LLARSSFDDGARGATLPAAIRVGKHKRRAVDIAPPALNETERQRLAALTVPKS